MIVPVDLGLLRRRQLRRPRLAASTRDGVPLASSLLSSPRTDWQELPAGIAIAPGSPPPAALLAGTPDKADAARATADSHEDRRLDFTLPPLALDLPPTQLDTCRLGSDQAGTQPDVASH